MHSSASRPAAVPAAGSRRAARGTLLAYRASKQSQDPPCRAVAAGMPCRARSTARPTTSAVRTADQRQRRSGFTWPFGRPRSATTTASRRRRAAPAEVGAHGSVASFSDAGRGSSGTFRSRRTSTTAHDSSRSLSVCISRRRPCRASRSTRHSSPTRMVASDLSPACPAVSVRPAWRVPAERRVVDDVAGDDQVLGVTQDALRRPFSGSAFMATLILRRPGLLGQVHHSSRVAGAGQEPSTSRSRPTCPWAPDHQAIASAPIIIQDHVGRGGAGATQVLVLFQHRSGRWCRRHSGRRPVLDAELVQRHLAHRGQDGSSCRRRSRRCVLWRVGVGDQPAWSRNIVALGRAGDDRLLPGVDV